MGGELSLDRGVPDSLSTAQDPALRSDVTQETELHEVRVADPKITCSPVRIGSIDQLEQPLPGVGGDLWVVFESGHHRVDPLLIDVMRRMFVEPGIDDRQRRRREVRPERDQVRLRERHSGAGARDD
jgi:hypothetical protein